MGKHSPGFEALCEDAKSRINELSAQAYFAQPIAYVLVDVREDREWDAGRIQGAQHLGKGVLERDIEARFAKDEPLVLYCGGGFRSALAADMLQKMGYTNVFSLAGGIRVVRAEHSQMIEVGPKS